MKEIICAGGYLVGSVIFLYAIIRSQRTRKRRDADLDLVRNNQELNRERVS